MAPAETMPPILVTPLPVTVTTVAPEYFKVLSEPAAPNVKVAAA